MPDRFLNDAAIAEITEAAAGDFIPVAHQGTGVLRKMTVANFKRVLDGVAGWYVSKPGGGYWHYTATDDPTEPIQHVHVDNLP